MRIFHVPLLVLLSLNSIQCLGHDNQSQIDKYFSSLFQEQISNSSCSLKYFILVDVDETFHHFAKFLEFQLVNILVHASHEAFECRNMFGLGVIKEGGLAVLKEFEHIRALNDMKSWIEEIESSSKMSYKEQATIETYLELVNTLDTLSNDDNDHIHIIHFRFSHQSEAYPLSDLQMQAQELSTIISSSISLSMVFDTSKIELCEAFGFPDHDNSYNTGDGFSKALTLQAAIEQGGSSQSSLQAYLLSQGIFMRIMDLKRLMDATTSCEDFLIKSDIDTFNGSLTPRELYYHFSASWNDRYQDVLQHPRHRYSNDIFASYKRARRMFPEHYDSHCSDSTCDAPETLNDPFETTNVPILEWEPQKPFAEEIIERGQPVVLKNTITSTWSGIESWKNLSQFFHDLGHENLTQVKMSNQSRISDPDKVAAMWKFPLLNHSIGYKTVNSTKQELLQLLEQHDNGDADVPGVSYFNDISETLHEGIKPDFHLYLSSDDWMYRRQFIWVSTSGLYTHIHFDQDFNFFVQLRGKKKFTLWSYNEWHNMYMFPRVHPLWHKSQVNFKNPDFHRFPMYRHVKKMEVEVEPGDILYIPPYYWHNVETLDGVSLSLSTLSHDEDTIGAMEEIYKMDHKFDRIASPRGQMFALRLYLDMLIHELVGNHPHETQRYFKNLLNVRYSVFETLFTDKPDICLGADQSPKIPTAQHVYGDCLADMMMITPPFKAMKPAIRDLLLVEYIEEISEQVVGIRQLYSFFTYCFNDQDYYVTEQDQPEHDELWTYKSFD